MREKYSIKEKQSCQPRMRLLTCIILYLLKVISGIQRFRLRGGAGFNNWEDSTLPRVVAARELSAVAKTGLGRQSWLYWVHLCEQVFEYSEGEKKMQ